LCLQGQQRHPRVHLKQVFVVQLGQALQGSFHVLVPVTLDDFALGADDRGGEQAGARQLEPRIEGFLIEGIDPLCEVLWNMLMAHVLAHHAGILALVQGLVLAMTRA